LLTLIIAASGGVENPFVVFYLFHMAISALLLTTGQAIGQGLWAVALYCGMGWGQYFGWFGTHYEFLATLPCPHAYADLAFVSAMCVVQAVAVAGTLYFTIRIARRLDMQEGQLRDALDELAASRARLAELQERRARFMATAAHQLKSPFAAIQTMASLIRDDYVTGDAVRKTVEAITRRCAEAIEAVGQLLTLARVREADPRRHRTGGANIRAVVEEIARRRGSEARGKGLNFDVRLDAPADLRAPIDPRDLADCVDNLVENAIKYTPGPGLVSLSVETTGDTVAIEVADTGIGIAEVDLGDAHSRDSRSPIFEPYRRGNVALEAGISGSGLGLSIVREVIEQTGGTIAVRSQVGSGSKFTITWPRPVAGASAGTAADTNALVQT
jgi:signal transduction histidine kinase